MNLKRLIGCIVADIDDNIQINSITIDSRLVTTNSLFIALKGSKVNAKQYIDDAIVRGASAVLVESDNYNFSHELRSDIPIYNIPRLREQLGTILNIFYDNIVDKIKVIAVTGTNGKTSCVHYIAELLNLANIPCASIGGLGVKFKDFFLENKLTTPSVVDLYASLNLLHQQGAKYVAIEVSSHALEQHRINGLNIEVAVFTNFTQDHLDYHGSMEKYWLAKRALFDNYQPKNMVANLDDPKGHELNQRFAGLRSFGQHTDAGLRLLNAEFSLAGTQARIMLRGEEFNITTSLLGKFNLDNILAAISVLDTITAITTDKIANLVANLSQVAGRMQLINLSSASPYVVIDYAHTPDGLEVLLNSLRAMTSSPISLIFGCGGERDKVKRPLMMDIAIHLADKIIITADNTRSENFTSIVNDMLQNVAGRVFEQKVNVIKSRKEAIYKTIHAAKSPEIVVIAGKGHESYHIVGDTRFPWSDQQEAIQALELVES